jgi:hypothetical protein
VIVKLSSLINGFSIFYNYGAKIQQTSEKYEASLQYFSQRVPQIFTIYRKDTTNRAQKQ